MSERYFAFIEDLKRLSAWLRLPVRRRLGERLYGPSNTKCIGCEIVIENIPVELTDLELAPILARIGKIHQFRIAVHADDPLQHLGMAYCSFSNSKCCDLAVLVLNGFEILDGRRLVVRKSRENCTLFVGNVHPFKTRTEIHDAILQSGMKGVKDITIYKSHSDPRKHRGFVFITFHKHMHAFQARSEFRNRLSLFGKHVQVDWGTILPEITSEHSDTSCKLFLRNLDVYKSRAVFYEDIKRVLGDGNVNRVYKFNDYAFIHFNSQKEAQVGKVKLEAHFKNTLVDVQWGITSEFYSAINTSENDTRFHVQRLVMHFEDFWLNNTLDLITFGNHSTSDFECDCLLPHYYNFEHYYKVLVCKTQTPICPKLRPILAKILYSFSRS